MQLVDAFAQGNRFRKSYCSNLFEGKWNKVPLIMGTDLDDAVLFVYGIKNATTLSLPVRIL